MKRGYIKGYKVNSHQQKKKRKISDFWKRNDCNNKRNEGDSCLNPFVKFKRPCHCTLLNPLCLGCNLFYFYQKFGNLEFIFV